MNCNGLEENEGILSEKEEDKDERFEEQKHSNGRLESDLQSTGKGREGRGV